MVIATGGDYRKAELRKHCGPLSWSLYDQSCLDVLWKWEPMLQ